MKQHPFTENFQDSTESKSLIDAGDLTRVREIVRLKKLDLLALEGKNKKNFHGYEYELEAWRFFYSLKPDYISNISTNFKFNLSQYRQYADSIDAKDRAYQSSKQTDILAIYGKHVFVVECKSTEKKQSSEKLAKEIELFKSLNQHKTARIKEIFGPEYIPVYIVCTRGYELDSKDQIQSLRKDGIILFSEKYQEYIQAVLESSESPEFALIQFLGFFRSGEHDYNHYTEKNGNVTKTPWKLFAFNSNSGAGKKNNVYTFSISPNDMLKIATVSHQKAKVIFETQSTTPKHYQRLLQKGRLKKIGEHLSANKTPFPNNILVSYRGDEPLQFKELKRTKKANIGRFPGELIFNACPGTFHVIDGQHRLFGYTALEKNKPLSLRDSHRIIVTVFEGLDIEEEAEIFLEVNQEAKPVHASLIMEIQYSTEKVSQVNLANGLVFSLRDKDTSSLFKKINQAEETRKAPLQTKNFQSALMPLQILNGKNFKTGIFWDSKSSNWIDMLQAQENIYQHLNDNLNIIKSDNLDRWEKKNGILQDIFFQGLLDVIDRVTMQMWDKVKVGEESKFFNTNKITGKTKPIIRLLAESIANESQQNKDELFNMQRYGKGSTARNVVAAVLIDKYLSRKHPKLKFKRDEDYLKPFNSSTMPPQEVKKALKNNKLIEARLKKIASELTKVKKQTRIKRGEFYHGLLKDLVHLVLQKEDHYDVDYWDTLIMTGFWKKDNAWGGVIDRWNEEKSSAGANAYKNPMNHVEGNLIRQILMFPQRHRKAEPVNNKEKRIELTINYMWDHFLIFKNNEDLESYTNLKKTGADDSSLWKKGTEYIDLFAKFRNYSAHPRLADETANPLAQEEDLFDHYEKYFTVIVDEIARDLIEKSESGAEVEN